MEPLNDLGEHEMNRDSILSKKKFSRKEAEENAPRDNYYIVHFLFFFLGLGSLMSMSFFLTANDYWMYKFRDVTQEDYSSSNKTTLQSYFAAYAGIALTVPNLLTTFIVTLFGHKINIKFRLLGSLSLQICVYMLFTIFIKINTDTWQTAFFVVTLIGYVFNAIASTTVQLASYSLVSRFPGNYMKMNMYGQGCTGLFSAVLQIISLAIGGSTTASALIYFSCGTAALIVATILVFFSFTSPRFRFFLGDTAEAQKRKVPTFKEMNEVARKIWPVLVVFYSYMMAMGMGHPMITSLIYSEGYGNGNPWNDKYFVPVVTFLSGEIFNQIGRFFGYPIITHKTAIPFVIVHLIRLIIFGPIFMFCRTNPKEHLPLLFPHDWQYMILIAANGLGMSFFLTCAFLSLPKLAGKQTELGFLLMQSLGLPLTIVFSFLSPLYVKIL